MKLARQFNFNIRSTERIIFYAVAGPEHHRKTCGNYKQGGGGANTQQASRKVSNYQPSDKMFRKFSGRICVDRYEGPAHVFSKVLETEKKVDADR